MVCGVNEKSCHNNPMRRKWQNDKTENHFKEEHLQTQSLERQDKMVKFESMSLLVQNWFENLL